MLRILFAVVFLGAGACSSDAQGGPGDQATGGASGGQGCPDVNGKWKVTNHCDATLVGMTLDVTEKDCALSFAAPFDQFMGSVTDDDKVMLSGPQACTGSATATAISMVCTPGTCNVTLAR